MSPDEVAIRVRNISKHYLMFNRPEDRLKQAIVPRLQNLIGRPRRNYYEDFVALHDVSFDIKRGETVGIVGRNGSGKSTLLQIISGTMQPTSGSVEVNGRVAALLELGAGFNPDFTGRENVYLNAAILGLSRSEIDDRFESIARFADIGQFIEQPVKTYSSGMYVRLAFATAVNVDADILIVDEALSVGDEGFQRKCFGRIEEIQDRGGTILFVSHGAQTIVQLASRAMLFDGGELCLEGPPKMVTSQYQRLINASPEAAPDIRAALTRLRESTKSDQEPTTVDFVSNVEDDPEKDFASAPEPEQPGGTSGLLADFYDANLKPQSTVYFEERGARIRNVRLLTLKGVPVNVLQLGKRYVFEYDVDFSVDAANVGFGMMFRTSSGFALAGAQTRFSRTQRTSQVAAGDIMRVQFEFSCLMLPGVYFAGCGAYGSLASEQVVLHRIHDVVMLKVAPEQDLLANGRFDIGATPRIRISRPGRAFNSPSRP